MTEVSEQRENLLRKSAYVKKNDDDEDDDKGLEDDTSVNARESSYYSNRYMFQYFSFFCINLFQLATAFFYV
jgi:hypothetical protein